MVQLTLPSDRRVCNNDFVSPSTALGQGLQVASPTQSPNTFPQGMITTYSPEPVAQAGSGQLRTSGVAVTKAAPAPSTPPVGMVANVLQHQLASPGGFVRLLSAGFWTNARLPDTIYVAGPRAVDTDYIFCAYGRNMIQ